MHARPQVLVGNDTVAHDLDGIGIAGFDDGSHLLQLMLGMGYDSRCIAVTDRNPGVWDFMGAPSIMLSRDEHEVWQRDVKFSLAPITVPVSVDAPRLKLLRPIARGGVRLIHIFVQAELNPFRWQARVALEGLHDLVCDDKGWSLGAEKVEFRIDLEVSVGST